MRDAGHLARIGRRGLTRRSLWPLVWLSFLDPCALHQAPVELKIGDGAGHILILFLAELELFIAGKLPRIPNIADMIEDVTKHYLNGRIISLLDLPAPDFCDQFLQMEYRLREISCDAG